MMKILEDLISTLDLSAEVQDVQVGLFHTGVLTRHCGLASTLSRDALRTQGRKEPLVREPGALLEKSAADLAGMARSTSIPEAAIGMAAINSLLEVDEERCHELNAAELIAEKGRGRRVAIVGHFPFIPRLRDLVRELWVIEKNPRPGDQVEDRADALIPRADVVGLTGSSFTNHTFDKVIKLCDPGAYVVVLGDTTPLSPLLFDHGVDAISGTRVVDPQAALSCISQGANFRQIRGKRLLTMTR